MRHLRSLLKCSAAALILALPLVMALEAIAQIRFIAPQVGAPGNREAGTSRSETCAASTGQRLTAVVPETNLGLTTKAFPTFFAYLPANNATGAELHLYEEASGEQVYVAQIAMPPANEAAEYRYQPTVLQLSAPVSASDSAPGAVTLEPGKNYIWALMLICDPAERTDDVIAIGVVQRVDAAYLNRFSADLQRQLTGAESVPAETKLSTYGRAGIWHELLETLAPLAKSDPVAYQDDWAALLDQQGLGAIADAPIVNSQVDPL
ncbi:MAG: DUF928 domain-containing protein [Elainellaceae cyanobacterium]